MTLANQLFTLSLVISIWLVASGEPYWGALMVSSALALVTGLLSLWLDDRKRAKDRAEALERDLFAKMSWGDLAALMPDAAKQFRKDVAKKWREHDPRTH